MPKLPSIADYGPREEIRAPAGVVSIDSPRRPSNVGDVLMAGGAQISHEVAIETERVNRLRAEGAMNDLLNVEQELSIGEGGFAHLEGANAATRPLAKEYTDRFTDKRKAIESSLANDQQREIFAKRADIVQRGFGGKLIAHATKQADVYEKQVVAGAEAAAITNAENNFANDDLVDTYVERFAFLRRERGTREGEPTEVTEAAIGAARDKVWTARLASEATQNPVAAYARLHLNRDNMSVAAYRRLESGLFQAADDLLATRAAQALPKLVMPEGSEGGGGTANVSPGTFRTFAKQGQFFETAVDSLLKREGGYNASDGKSAAPVNFGINQRANPDIDVKSLTRDKAVELYRTRYWKAIDGDSLAPATALVALDAAALQGPAVAKRLIADTGGDPAQMIAQRRQQLQALAASDPEHRKHLGSWMRRLDGVEAEAATLERGGVEQRQQAQSVALATMTPADMEKVQTGDPLIDNLPPHRKLAVLQKAQTMAKQESAQMRDGVTARFQDSVAALERGIEPPNAPSATELVLAHGQVDGMRKARELAESRQFGLDVKAVSTMSPAEQAALVTARAPQAGDGFAIGQRRQEQLLRAVEQTNSARAADPAAFAIQYAPPVQRAYQAMQTAAPEARAAAAQAFADATISEQRRLGVPEPKVLPKAMADQVVREFLNPADGQSQSAARWAQAQSAQWGKYWPEVYKQVAKHITPTARVVSNLGDTPAATLLSANAGETTENLKKLIPAADAKAAADKLEVELEPFRKSIMTGNTRGAVDAYNDYEDAAKRLAYLYTSAGTKPSEAAKRAAQEVVGEYYEFRGTVRIPKADANRQPIDPQAVDRGIGAVLRSAEAIPFMIPEGEARAAKTLGKEFTQKQMATAIKGGAGFFATLGDDSGVALHMRGVNGERPVQGADGRPITFTWRELAERAVAGVPKPGDVQYGETDSGAATGRTVTRRPKGGS